MPELTVLDVAMIEVGPLGTERVEEADVMGMVEVMLVGGSGTTDVEVVVLVLFTGGMAGVVGPVGELVVPCPGGGWSPGARGKILSKMPAFTRESSTSAARSNSVVRRCIFLFCFLLMADIAVDVSCVIQGTGNPGKGPALSLGLIWRNCLAGNEMTRTQGWIG